MPDEVLHQPLSADGNSLAVLFQHIGNNLRSRFTDFLTTDGEKSWRHRDQEFVEGGAVRAALLAQWNEGWSTLEATLSSLSAEDMSRDVRIRDVPLRVDAALLRSLAHVAYHVGQVVQLARHLYGDDWQSLSIPRGDSIAYRQNPTKERSPGGSD
ncbi:MAG: hypothetical protein ACI841_001310 [Planctomycetota bacterium]|jgi:hypothetical protein